jgi:hypothetical protein
MGGCAESKNSNITLKLATDVECYVNVIRNLFSIATSNLKTESVALVKGLVFPVALTVALF